MVDAGDGHFQFAFPGALFAHRGFKVAPAEGLDVSAAARIFGHTKATIQHWLTRAGMPSEGLHQHLMRDADESHSWVFYKRNRCERHIPTCRPVTISIY